MELKLNKNAMDLAEVLGMTLQRAAELTDVLNDLVDEDGTQFVVDIVKVFELMIPSLPDNEILYIAFQLGRFTGRQEAFALANKRDALAAALKGNVCLGAGG